MTLVLPPRPTRECGLTISCAVSNPRIELQDRWKSAVWLRAAREKPRSQERGLFLCALRAITSCRQSPCALAAESWKQQCTRAPCPPKDFLGNLSSLKGS